jgi:hypothetical protein
MAAFNGVKKMPKWQLYPWRFSSHFGSSIVTIKRLSTKKKQLHKGIKMLTFQSAF